MNCCDSVAARVLGVTLLPSLGNRVRPLRSFRSDFGSGRDYENNKNGIPYLHQWNVMPPVGKKFQCDALNSDGVLIISARTVARLFLLPMPRRQFLVIVREQMLPIIVIETIRRVCNYLIALFWDNTTTISGRPEPIQQFFCALGCSRERITQLVDTPKDSQAYVR